MFNSILRLGVVGSLCFIIPTRIDGDELFSFYALAFLVVLSLFTERKREVDLRFLGLCLLYALVTTVVSLRFPVRQVFVNCLVGVLGIKVIAERFDFNYFTLGLTSTAFVAMSYVFIVLQHLGIPNIYTAIYPEMAGVSFMPWILGCTSVLIMPFIYVLSPWLVVVLIPLIYLSQSIVCVGTGVIVFLICLFRDHRKLSVLAGLFLFPLAAWYYFQVDGGIDPHRLQVWKNALPHFKNWWFGSGMGSWAHSAFLHFNGHDPYHWRWAHNEFYQHVYEQGWVGLGLLGTWILSLCLKARRDLIIIASLAGLFLISIFHPVMHLGKFLFLDCVILGIAEGNRAV